MVPSFHKAPHVAVVGISGTGNLVGKLVASEAAVVLLRDARRTNVHRAQENTHVQSGCPVNDNHVWCIRASGTFVTAVHEVDKPQTQSTGIRVIMRGKYL